MSKFRLLHDLVLIKTEPLSAKKSDAGIVTINGAKGAPMEGVVLSVGPGKYDGKGNFITSDLQPGDQVIFATGGRIDIAQMGRDFVVVPASEVLLRLRPEEPEIPDLPELLT